MFISFPRSLWLAVVLGATCAALGCGSSSSGGGPQPTPPTISNLAYSPNSVLQSSTGTGMINGSLDFADSGGDVSALNLTVFDASQQQLSSTSTPIQGVAGVKSGTITGAFEVPINNPGSFSFQLSVADSGGSKSNALTGTFQIVAASNLAAVVTTTGTSPASLTAANGNLYWSETGEAVLKSVPASGGVASQLAFKVVNPLAMAFSGSDAIWLDDESAVRVLKRTSANGTTSVLATDTNSAPFTGNDIVLDGNTVFWISSTLSPNTYVIHATPINGGTSMSIVTTNTPVVALADRAGTLYWMENLFPMGGTIRSVPATGVTISTVVSGFVSDANTFAVDNASVYYATANFPYNIPTTDALVSSPLAGGSPGTLLPSTPRITKLAVGGGQVVWIDAATVNSIPAAGGAKTVLATTTPNTPLDVLIDGSNALWTESSGAAHGETGAIKSVAVTGGTPSVVYQGGDAPRHLAIDLLSQINWTEGGPVGLMEGFGRIARITAGNAVQTVVSGVSSDSPSFIATATDLFIADSWRVKRLSLGGGMPVTTAAGDGPIAGLATDGTSVYWDDLTDGHVSKAPASGGNVTVLVSAGQLGTMAGPGGSIRLAPSGNLFWAVNPSAPNSSALLSAPSTTVSTSAQVLAQGLPIVSDVAVDATKVYIAEPTTGNILSVPTSGGTLTTLTSTGFPLATFLLDLDGSTVYWVDTSQIAKVPVAGGTSTQVVSFVSGSNPAVSIAVDSKNLYWTEPAAIDIRQSIK
jgi:sugar lactone lactonase YvrE